MLERGSSHKDMSGDGTPWVLKLYYSQLILFTVCSLNELFLLLAYAAAQAGWVALPDLGPADAIVRPLAVAALPPLGRPPALAAAPAAALGWCLVVSAPVFAFKQVTSAVQLVWAMGRVARADERTRAGKDE